MGRSYRASGKLGDGALPVLIVACFIGGCAAGALESYLSHWFNPFILFPVLIGVGAGFPAASLIPSRHIRAPIAAAIIAGLAGAAGQITFHAVSYAQFRQTVADQMKEEGDTETTVDQALTERTGSAGIAGYGKLMAEEGTEVKKAGQQNGLKFDGTGWWLLSLGEVLMAAFVAGAMAWSKASEPYCESCGRWYDVKEIEGSGSGDKAVVAEVKGALGSEAWARAAEVLGTSDGKRVTSFEVRRCGQCQSHEPMLSVHLTVKANTKKPRTQRVFRTVMRYDEYTTLHDALVKRTTPT